MVLMIAVAVDFQHIFKAKLVMVCKIVLPICKRWLIKLIRWPLSLQLHSQHWELTTPMSKQLTMR